MLYPLLRQEIAELGLPLHVQHLIGGGELLHHLIFDANLSLLHQSRLVCGEMREQAMRCGCYSIREPLGIACCYLDVPGVEFGSSIHIICLLQTLDVPRFFTHCRNNLVYLQPPHALQGSSWFHTDQLIHSRISSCNKTDLNCNEKSERHNFGCLGRCRRCVHSVGEEMKLTFAIAKGPLCFATIKGPFFIN